MLYSTLIVRTTVSTEAIISAGLPHVDIVHGRARPSFALGAFRLLGGRVCTLAITAWRSTAWRGPARSCALLRGSISISHPVRSGFVILWPASLQQRAEPSRERLPPRAGRAPVTDGRAADRTTHWAEAVRRSAVLSLRCSAADWRTSRSAAACSLRPLTEARSQFDVVQWPEPAGAVAGLRPELAVEEPAVAPQLAR